MSAPKPIHIPHAEDMDRMTDIHDRLIRRAALLVPMNRNDEDVLGDAAIPFQDEAYACGLARGQQECNAELLEALRDMLAGWKYIRGFHGDLYGVGWDRAQEKAESAIAKAVGAAQ